MSNSIKFCIIFSILLGIGFIAYAQEENVTSTIDATQQINLDENIQAEDLEISEPNILPDNPIYFLKEWGRNIQSVFTFNPIAKAKLKEKFANEKLIELKKMVEQNKAEERIEKGIKNYQNEMEEAKKVIERIKETAEENIEVGKFLDKFIQQQVLQETILKKLETQVPPEVFAKIEAAREKHLEKFGEVMNKLQENKEQLRERLEKNLQEVKGSEFKNFKNLEILKDLEEKVPGEAREAIQKTQENVLKRLQGDVEKMSSEDQTKFQDYIEKIGGVKERQMEILDSLKTGIQNNPQVIQKLLQTREKIIEQVQNKIRKKIQEGTCPEVKFDVMPCPKGRYIIMKDEKGCDIDIKCVIPADVELPSIQSCKPTCEPICDAIGTRSEGWYDSCTKTLIKWGNCEGCEAIFKEVGWYSSCANELIKYGKCKEEPMACITLWDPVCGKDGKTYSNECFAKLGGTEAAYEGACGQTESKLYCQTDTDCACGVKIGTQECFYGNKKYVGESSQCPDFCGGIGGNMVIKCIENECQKTILNSQ